MPSPHEREDVSKFLVHLTRDTDRMIGAEQNLLNILKTKTIEARNFHCLFSPKIRSREFNFTEQLKSQFKTVCFTETPLTQIKHLSGEIVGRRIHLKPFGLVFWKQTLINKGANPAIYINEKGINIKQLLIHQFDETFRDINKWNHLKRAEEVHHLGIVQYFSLLNVVSQNHNFLWEREWRYHGNFTFKFNDIVAVIAKNPDDFKVKLQHDLTESQWNLAKRIPIISPSWSYEDVIEELSLQIWDNED